MRELLAAVQDKFPRVPVGAVLDAIEEEGWEVRPAPVPYEAPRPGLKPHEAANQWVETVKAWDTGLLDRGSEFLMENVRPPLSCRLGFHTARRSQGRVGYCMRMGCEDFLPTYSDGRIWTRYVTPLPPGFKVLDHVGGMPTPDTGAPVSPPVS